ncbi:MAG: OmpA family protein [Sulfuriferula sp.]|nr:OmpA family protein [Sulfuriferula sp.]
MSRTLRNLVAISCALMAGQAVAADMDTRIYLAPNVNYTFADSDWGVDDAFGFGVALGKPVSESFNLELNANYASHSHKAGSGNSGSLDNVGLSVDALYFFNRNPDFAPYLVAGIGGLNSRATGLNETNFAANAGVGFMKMFNGVGFRSDVRYRYTDNVGSNPGINPGDWIVSAGLVIPLGAAPVAPAPEPAPAPAPYVAPAPAPEPAPAPQPEVARPAAHTKIVLEGTNFDFNKATLRPTGKMKLDENVKTLTQYPDINVEISGHTDSIGSPKYNMKLSEKRAETVKKYMESKGIAASRMTTKGYGETKPIASNKTKAGRAENRRVEIEIMN